jgi:hypothetical protein
MNNFVENLKKHLQKNVNKFVTHYDMMGDTEGGFYEQDDFSLEDLLKEIDEFSATFKKD